MFTGIIQEIGTVREVMRVGGGVRLTVEAKQTSTGLRINDSVCINGVCQTVIEKKPGGFVVEAVEETLAKTTLSGLVPGGRVNIEPALQLGDRLGGHLVQGHVDGVGTIESVVARDSSWIVEIRIPEAFLRYVVPIGSIAIDGISLTVASIHADVVAVSIIPHTMDNTNFSSARPGTLVNIELDVVGKYLERFVSVSKGPSELTSAKLKEWGY